MLGARQHPGSTAITVNNGGTLTLDNITSGTATRLPITGTLNMSGGTFNFNGPANATQTETLAVLNLLAGQSVINVNPGTNGGTTLNFNNGATNPSLTRVVGATVMFQGANLGTTGATGNQILFTPTIATQLINNILPFATVNGTDWATYTGTGIGALPPASYSTTLTAGANVKLSSGSFTVPVRRNDVYGQLAGVIRNVTLNIPTGVTLAVTSGGCWRPAALPPSLGRARLASQIPKRYCIRICFPRRA